MEAAKVQLASVKQKRFIQTLVRENGTKVTKPLEQLSSQEASRLIDRLLQTGQESNTARQSRESYWDKRAEEVKLGLATKCVYNKWAGNILGIANSKRIKEAFIKEVLETYQVFCEIGQLAAQQNSQGEAHE